MLNISLILPKISKHILSQRIFPGNDILIKMGRIKPPNPVDLKVLFYSFLVEGA